MCGVNCYTTYVTQHPTPTAPSPSTLKTPPPSLPGASIQSMFFYGREERAVPGVTTSAIEQAELAPTPGGGGI